MSGPVAHLSFRPIEFGNRCGVMTLTSCNLTDFGDRQAQKLAEPIAYLPLSSLASPNPTMPSPEVSPSIPPIICLSIKPDNLPLIDHAGPSLQDLAIPLPPSVFAQPLRRDILHRCSVYYLANLRQVRTRTRAIQHHPEIND